MIEIKSETADDRKNDILMGYNIKVSIDGRPWNTVEEITLKIKANEAVIADIVTFGIGELDMIIPPENIRIHKIVYTNSFWEMIKYRIKKLFRKR